MRRKHFGCIAAITLVFMLAMPGLAFAQVTVDDTTLEAGENSVGGGTATYVDSVLDIVGVTAGNVTTDEDLTVNFNGGNDIDHFEATGDSNVTVNFSGENAVEDLEAHDNVNMTVNVNGHDDLEDIEAYDQASLTVNVTGESGCEAVKGYDDATVLVQGTTYPQGDVLEVGDGEADERIGTENGNLTIKNLTVVFKSEMGSVTSTAGDVRILCSKITGEDDNKRVDIHAGGTLFIGGSVIDIDGNVSSDGWMIIRRSDVDVEKADGDDSPYRVWSRAGITLIEEKNGEVLEGTLDGNAVWYVYTGDDDEVHLKSALTPCYYGTSDDSEIPRTADSSGMAVVFAVAALGVGALIAGMVIRKREEVED